MKDHVKPVWMPAMAGMFLRIGIAILALMGCRDMKNPSVQRARTAAMNEGDIVVGAAASWSEASYMLWEGIELAVHEINASGGVLGRRISMVKADDHGDVSQGELVAHQFAKNMEMVAVVGHVESYVTIPASVIYEYYGLLMITPYATNPRLTRQGFKKIFRCIPSDEVAGARLASFAAEQGFKRMMIYYIGNEYGNSLANAFEKQGQNCGLTIVDRVHYDSSSQARQFRTDLSSWKEDYEFDAIFFAGEVPQAAYFILEARDLGIMVPMIGGDGLDSMQLVEIAGAAAEGTFIGSTFHQDAPRPEVQAFVKAFQDRYGKPPDGAAGQGYDVIKTLAHGMEQAGSTVPEDVAQALRSIRPPLSGVTGSIQFDENGDLVRQEILIKVVRNDRLEYFK